MAEVCEGLLSWADATLERAEAEAGSCDGDGPGEDDEDDEEEAEEKAELVKAEAESNDDRSCSTFRSLEERLLRLHVRESLKDAVVSSHVNPCRNLLDLLLRSDPSLSRLLLSVGPDGLLSLKSLVGGKESLLIEGLSPDDPLLNYFESQELPPVLLDLLEPKLWMEGCVLAEVRRSSLFCPSYKTLLLRPSTQSIICDSNLMASGWPSEEKSSLEGELALLLSGPLCLDPNPVVSLVARKSLLSRQKLNTVPLRRMHRKRRWQKEAPPPPPHTLLDFIHSQRQAKGGSAPEETLAKHQASVRASIRNGAALFMQPTLSQAPPLSTDVSKRARTIQKRAEMNDMTPHVVEEYILETAERSMTRVYHTRLTIYQRLANDEYLGELYVERDYRENDNKGSTCRFVLGTQPHALRYINQFTEIFTEGGRKSVKITHRVPNQPPRVTYTPGMRERLHERDKILVKNNNAVFNTIPKQTLQPQQQQQTTRIIQFNSASTAQPNNSHNNNVATPSILQTQLQRTTAAFSDENNTAQATSLASQQQQQKDMEISAIKQALMKESAEFEANKSSKTFAQLPTRPVPQASLADNNVVTPPTLKATLNPKLVSERLPLHEILTAQAVQQQQQIQLPSNAVKVSQLSRPVISGTLPSYSQAQQNSIKSKLVVTPSQTTKIGMNKPLSHDAPGLEVLLANTPSADSPACPTSSGGSVSVGGTLLERLVSGQAIVTTSTTVSATPSPLTASSSDSTNDITLAALLAKPAATGGVTTSQTTIYSTKMSPLLQQLQQPAQPVRTSVRQTPLLSPRLISSSPRPQQPQQQQFSTSQTPVITHSKSLNTVPTSTMITLPVREAVNGFNDGSTVQTQQTTQQTTNVVSLQNLLQSGVVNNSGGIVTSSSSSIPVQLSIQGLPSPVTLSVNLSEGANSTDSASSSPNVFVTRSAGNVIGQGQQKVNLPKIVTSGNQTVLFQSPGNIIQLPQQATSLANMKPVVTSQIKTVTSGSPLLQVRPGQPVFLQVPNSQNKNTGQIQIVRTQSIVRPSSGVQSSTPSQQVVINSLKSPVGNAISPQQVGLLSPSSSIPASPQQLNESNLVAIQLQQQQQQQQQQLPSPASQEHQQLILATAPQKQSISQIKVRQQRKQTSK